MKKIYLGENEVARKVKTAYLGVDNVARKVKKAYLGVNNVARPVMASEITYWGEATPLGWGRPGHMSGSTSDYALFAGGAYAMNDCETYDKSLTYRAVDGLNEIRIFGGGVSLDNTVIFAGGFYSHSGFGCSDVEKYDNSLTKSSLPDLDMARGHVCGLDIGNYAVFVGGLETDSGYSGVNVIDYYDKSGTHFTSTITYGSYALSSAKAGKMGLFYEEGRKTFAFDSSMTLTMIDDYNDGIQNAKRFSAAASLGSYAVFAGGQGGINIMVLAISVKDVVKVFDPSLTKVAQISLKAPSSQLAGAGTGDFALFAGGCDDKGTISDVSCFDSSLTLKDIGNLKDKRRFLKSATVGSYLIFAGGCTNDFDTAVNSTEVFTF